MEDIKEKGMARLGWAEEHMPVLKELAKEIRERGSLKDRRIAMALHTEAKTGVLALSLARAGALVRLVSCNPLSTDDTVAAALKGTHPNLAVRAKKGESRDEYYSNLNWALDMKPHILIDDGGDLVKLVHTERQDMLPGILGGCEETTTGIIRLKAMEREGKLRFPVMNVNDCAMKHLFDNRYGTGQSTLDGILTATNITLAGKRIHVAGYGWCGRGIAMRMKCLGAVVSVSEVDPVKAVEAAHDGMIPVSILEAAPVSDITITATGCKGVVSRAVIDELKDGCILANSGHFDNEIDVSYLEEFEKKRMREHVVQYDVNGKRVNLISEGRLVNLAAGQGHPVEIMDMSFALQAAGAEMIALNRFENRVIPFPREIDERIARIKLRAMGFSLDELTEEQKEYLSSWEEGT
ncbi:adenosylhomocysteinase [Thermoplasmatales archaeon ex4484_6]|nr:MAG: adenosylhomocysteinase [Thermoplasmatales archaeon ex4484_6]RLF65674.1 MAG: adenosylhomocysteinase [Thermoplasmata archaeon]